MSCLSLPADELSRLQIIVKLQPTMLGQMSFRLQSQPLPNPSPAPIATTLKSSQGSPSMYAVNLQTEQDEDGQAILRVFTSLICGGASTSDINGIDSTVSSISNVSHIIPTQDAGAMVTCSTIDTFDQVSRSMTSSLTTNDDRRASVPPNMSDELKFVPSDFSMSPFFEDPSFSNTSSANHSPGAFSFLDSPHSMLPGDGITPYGGFDCLPFIDFDKWSSTDLTMDGSTLLSSHDNVILRRPTPISPATTSSTLSPMSTPSFETFEPDRDSSTSDSGRDTDHHRRFRCVKPGCGRRFTSQYTLKVHTEAHKAKPRVSLPCTLGCSERFSRRHDRLRHEVTQHGKVCEWVCSDCGRFFSSDKTLGNHKCPTTKISFAPSRVPN